MNATENQQVQAAKDTRIDTRGVTGRWLVETAALVLLAFVIAMGVRWLLVEPYRIPTGSMLPTIQIDDHILIYKLGTHLGATPDQQDVIVFYDPTDAFPNLVKRVVATEGQVVDLVDGQVVVDGEVLYEPYVFDNAPTEPLFPDSNLASAIEYPFAVPADHVFVMGDNRQRSSDSRAFGPVPVSEVKGVAFFTYWPISNFATLE
jgi:signal peptidase I